MSECKASLILAEDFRHFVRDHQLADPLATLASSRLLEQTRIYDGSVCERLAMALLRLVEVSGDVHSFSLTREELAQHIGVGRNSVTKALTQLGPGLVRAGKDRIEVTGVDGLRKTLAAATRA
ncbi:Crp/Fnr family transcriptional regulator [Streptomyces sp. yr375]|uniref:Crp/Fnr family transcriptional regulator n=1 Tax=Streptomyces sp. yr375 TaxID=1761906 RepID=UPI00210C94F5|nr:helix-turn-helix domain-containing protein [Streptomyces sp. yr375]